MEFIKENMHIDIRVYLRGFSNLASPVQQIAYSLHSPKKNSSSKKCRSTSVSLALSVSWPLNLATDPTLSAPVPPCTFCGTSPGHVLSLCMTNTWYYRCFRHRWFLGIPQRANCGLEGYETDLNNWSSTKMTTVIEYNDLSIVITQLWCFSPLMNL